MFSLYFFAFECSVLCIFFRYCKRQVNHTYFTLYDHATYKTKPNTQAVEELKGKCNSQKIGITLVMVVFRSKEGIWYICDTIDDKHGKDWIFKKVSQICRHSHIILLLWFYTRLLCVLYNIPC